MSGRRTFADTAGFTRHCWECANADFPAGSERGTCGAWNLEVSKYDSPNNCCSAAGGCWKYEMGGTA